MSHFKRTAILKRLKFNNNLYSLFARYYKCISDCCLPNDFGVFPQGDLTETDGNGNNLSGGQKQR